MRTFFWDSIVTLSKFYSSFCYLIRMAEFKTCAVFGVDPPVLAPDDGRDAKFSYLLIPLAVPPSFMVFDDYVLFREAEIICGRPTMLT